METFTEYDLKHFEDEAKHIHDKIIQAIRIRNAIVKKRSNALINLENSYALTDNLQREMAYNRAISELNNCFKNEQSLMGVVQKGLGSGIGVLQDLIQKFKACGINKELTALCETMLEVLVYTFENFENIKKRLFLEAQLVKDGFKSYGESGDRFEQFKILVQEEIEFDRNIQKKINSILKNMINASKRFGLPIGVGGLAGLTLGFLPATFVSQAQIIMNNGPYTTEPQIMILGIGAIVGAFIGIFYELTTTTDTAANALKIYKRINLKPQRMT